MKVVWRSDVHEQGSQYVRYLFLVQHEDGYVDIDYVISPHPGGDRGNERLLKVYEKTLRSRSHKTVLRERFQRFQDYIPPRWQERIQQQLALQHL